MSLFLILESNNLEVAVGLHKSIDICTFLLYGFSYEEVGEYFGRDHSTIIAGVRKHETYIEIKDSKYLKDIEEYDNLFQDNQRHIDTIPC